MPPPIGKNFKSGEDDPFGGFNNNIWLNSSQVVSGIELGGGLGGPDGKYMSQSSLFD